MAAVPLPNPYTSAIGPLITAHDVVSAVLETLQRWGSTYLAEGEQQTGRERGSLPRIRNWSVMPEFEKWPEDQLPAVLVLSPGLAEAPLPDGTGLYRARFLIGIAVVVSARTLHETRELAALYTAVLRTVLLQQQSLGGFASGVNWLDENYDDLPAVDTRSLGAGQAIFAVEVEGLARRWNGPPFPTGEVPEPPTDPIPQDPHAVDVSVEIHNEGVHS